MKTRPHLLVLFGIVVASLFAFVLIAQTDRATAAPNAADIRVLPSMVARGGNVVITGTGFLAGPVQIRLDGVSIGNAVADANGVLSATVTVPSNSSKPGLGTLSACSPNFCNQGPGAQNVSKVVRILPKLSNLPVGLLRRALDFVEASKSDTEVWQTAFLDDVATPFYRPDVSGEAYYEIPVRS